MDQAFKKVTVRMGKVIGEARRAAKISQEELAHRAEIDRTYISQIERGVCNPSLLIVHKVAKALELPLATIFKQL